MDGIITNSEPLKCALCDKEFLGQKPTEGQDVLCSECAAVVNETTPDPISEPAVAETVPDLPEIPPETPNIPPSADDNGVVYQVRVAVLALNVRSGAGTTPAVVKTLIKNDKDVYTIVEEADGPGASKWGRRKSGIGWVALDYVQKI